MKKKYTFFILFYGIISQNKYSTTSDSSGLNNLLPLKERVLFYALKLRTNGTMQISPVAKNKQLPSLEEILKRYPTFNPNTEEIDAFGNIKSRPIKIRRKQDDDDDI